MTSSPGPTTTTRTRTGNLGSCCSRRCRGSVRSARRRGSRVRLRHRHPRDPRTRLAGVRHRCRGRRHPPAAVSGSGRADARAHNDGGSDGGGRAPRGRPDLGGVQPLLRPPGRWSEVWPKVRAAVRPGGRFGGQILGERDTWASEQEISSFSRDDGRALFDGFEIERFEEEEEDGEACSGPKHWHLFHVLARRPRDRVRPARRDAAPLTRPVTSTRDRAACQHGPRPSRVTEVDR